MVARAVRYLDEESDVRVHVYTHFARGDYPEWKNQDKNPHIYLDYEVSNWGSLQTVSLQKCLKSLCMDGKRWEEVSAYGDQKPHLGNADFVRGEAKTIRELQRFYNYAVGTILRGNKPDFESLNVLFDQPFIAHGMVPISDVQADSYGSFAI
ncbi:MAG: hypothetical protein HRT94_00565 [Alphaproteobacteria bacterium]|nr:hypothetical protein [Alphaproteobacteria bacterium]